MPLAYGHDSVSADGPDRWLLECPRPKAWNPRTPSSRTSAEHPGTAVAWDGALYEVILVSRSGAGRIVYTLAPWNESHAIRRLEPYDVASESARGADRADLLERGRRRRMLVILSPLAGLLPARVQDRWEREYDLSASFLTLASAAPLFVYGAMCALFLTILGFTGVTFGLSMPSEIFGLYLLVESGVRISNA